MKVVVDANVCVSAVLSGRGGPARILDHALSEGPYDFDILAPSQLFPKLEDVLARPKIQKRLGWSEAEISTYVRRLRLFIQEIEVGDAGQVPEYTTDPEDDPYVHAAVLTRASYLISGDSNILDMQNPPVGVLDASQFVRLWKAGLL
ncbi:putative toxin-antitoxin system toxin component, PIN family [Rubrobacter indicoceani]|uniref:putative toxin-antitoxin system toxin component, PIN family n=1 Tax=Rubrobacter indicoceani TaxID=2051957 RepID=UPI000E5BA814|nr:putative toxin-antitoxin system toxin component, PIN family [Rubrobacter indicoceani]